MDCMEEAMIMPGTDLNHEIKSRINAARSARCQQAVLFTELAAIQEELERRVTPEERRTSGEEEKRWKKQSRDSSS